MFDFLIISSFNSNNLASLLRRADSVDGLKVDEAPYGQVMQSLLSSDTAMWGSHNASIVWTSPSSISTAYLLAVEGEPLDEGRMSLEVAEFADAIRRIPPRIQHIFVPTWIPFQPCEDRRGTLDMDSNYGIVAALIRMNTQLHEILRSDQRISIFNATRWLTKVGKSAYSAKLWYLSKTPFSVDLFREAAKDFFAAARALTGRSRKLLILDLDDTLWGGCVGETGWDNLRLGGHDPVGEAYRDFQLALLSLSRRGVLLAIVSKNEETVALDAIREHPEMALQLKDFVAWRINWKDKAHNIIDLVTEINLGSDAAVFIDDHPTERARIRETIPEVLVPEWPKSPLEFAAFLRGMDCFDVGLVSAEDRNRTSSYVWERERRREQLTAPSVEAWLQTLNLQIGVEGLTSANLERVVQLLNKTNQMNLRTRRMSGGQLRQWDDRPDNLLVTFRVKDRFGDYGLVGIGSVVVNRLARTAVIEDFVLSCRAMGRQVEQTMLCMLSAIAARSGAEELIAQYLETSRNKPCLTFFENSCERITKTPQELLFRINLQHSPSLPTCVTVDGFDELMRSLVENNTTFASRVDHIAERTT